MWTSLPEYSAGVRTSTSACAAGRRTTSWRGFGLPMCCSTSDLRARIPAWGGPTAYDVNPTTGTSRVNGLLLREPLLAAAVDEPQVLVAEQAEHPVRVRRPPVGLVAVQHDRRVASDAEPSHQPRESGRVNVVADPPVVEVDAPVDAHSPGDVASVVQRHVLVRLDHPNSRVRRVLRNPSGFDQHVGIHVARHSPPPADAPTGRAEPAAVRDRRDPPSGPGFPSRGPGGRTALVLLQRRQPTRIPARTGRRGARPPDSARFSAAVRWTRPGGWVMSQGESAELGSLRGAIADLDRSLLELLRRRMELAAEVGRVKAAVGAPVVVRDAEDRVLTRARQHAEACGVSADVMEEIFHAIMRGSVERQHRVGVEARRRRGGRVLVVGGAGAMGGWLCQFLTLVGHTVEATDPAWTSLGRAAGRYRSIARGARPRRLRLRGARGSARRDRGGHRRGRRPPPPRGDLGGDRLDQVPPCAGARARRPRRRRGGLPPPDVRPGQVPLRAADVRAGGAGTRRAANGRASRRSSPTPTPGSYPSRFRTTTA